MKVVIDEPLKLAESVRERRKQIVLTELVKRIDEITEDVAKKGKYVWWVGLKKYYTEEWYLIYRLRRAGFKTICISAMGNVSPSYGFNNGFDYFIELYKEKSVIKKRLTVESDDVGWQHHFRVKEVPISTSEDVNQFLFPFLEKYRNEDVFVLVWSIDTHDPYFHRNKELAKFTSTDNRIFWSKQI